MPKIKLDGGYVRFHCPGCGDEHILNVAGDRRPKWGFNEDLERPTLTPSINAKSGQTVDLPDIQ